MQRPTIYRPLLSVCNDGYGNFAEKIASPCVAKMDTASRRQLWQPKGLPPSEADDILYSGSDDEYYDSPAERRGRYEIQSARFLQGKSLTIFSAQLRGPFSKESGWQNPWLGRSKTNNGAKDMATRPIPQGLSTSRSNSATGYVSGGASVAVTPLRLDRLTQPSSCRIPSPIRSSSYGAASNPYMDGATWNRVHAWRVDVVANAEQAEGLQATVTSVAKTSPQAASRSKRPATSELLRNALAKKSRSSGVDLSIGEPLSPAGQNQSPRTGRRQVSDALLSTPDNRSLLNSHASPDNFSGAALDGSVTGQISIPRAAEMRVSSAGDSAKEKASSIPLPVVNVAEKTNDVSITPVQQAQPLSDGRQSAVVSRASGSERSPLRPNATKINARIHNLPQDSKRDQPAKGNVNQEASLNITEAQEQSPLDYCSQADRSFQYRSKAPRVSKRKALAEATQNGENVSQPSSPTETASENTGSPPEDLPSSDSKKIYSTGALETPNNSTVPDSGTSLRDMPNDKSIMAEDAADITTPGIDGPTLIPSSSAPLQQDPAPPSASRPEHGPGAEAHIRRNAIDNGNHALPELKSVPKRTSPPNELVEILSLGPRPSLETTKLVGPIHDPHDVQVSKGTPVVALDTAVRPRYQSHIGSKLDGDCEAHTQGRTSSDQGVTIESATKREPNVILPGPQQESPWAKGLVNITEDAGSASDLPVQQTPMQALVRPGPTGSRESILATAPMQQSPWTKENTLQTTLEVATDMPSAPLADYARQARRDTEPTEITAITASQNPWASDERPADANCEDPRRLLFPSPGRPLRIDGALYSSPVSSNHSPLRPTTDTATGGALWQALPSTPTQQSSLSTPDLTSSIKSFRDFMSPSPEPRRRSEPILSPKAGRIEKLDRRKSALSKSRRDREKRAHLRVSFALPGQDRSGTPAMDTDPDEALDGAELPCREAESPSLVRKASSQAPPRRASSPPLELSQSELPAEVTRFRQFFRTQARKGPQVKRPGSYTPLLPSASQQRCGSPEADAMAGAFIEADRARGEQGVSGDSGAAPEEEERKEAGDQEQLESEEQSPEEDEEPQEIDDVTAVLDNLGDFLNSFDVEADLDKARREEQQQQERPQELGLGFPNTQDQMEIMGAGVWD